MNKIEENTKINSNTVCEFKHMQLCKGTLLFSAVKHLPLFLCNATWQCSSTVNVRELVTHKELFFVFIYIPLHEY